MTALVETEKRTRPAQPGRTTMAAAGTAVRTVRVRLDRTTLRGWHLRLLERLNQRPDCRLQIDAVQATGAGLPPNVELLFRLEATVHGVPRPGLSTPAEPLALAPYGRLDRTAPDLVIDLSGAETGSLPGVETWRLDYDGIPGETGLLVALFDRVEPVAALRDGSDAPIATGRFGAESHSVMLIAFEDYLARTITLIEAALSGGASRQMPDGTAPPALAHVAFDIGAMAARQRALKGLARRVARRLYTTCFHRERWRVGWRRTVGPDLIDLRRHPAGGWTDLPDNGRSFYADPFAVSRNGAVTLFVEEYDYARGKGVISAVPFGQDGPVGRPEAVLELDTHLSYPFVFEADGEVWMIPESCGTRSIDLYRAERFPGGWRHEAVLIPNVVASDPTLLRHGGRWWLFATVREGGSYSDSLHLWFADDFRGPWTAHPRNPVLIDVATARPAGPVVSRDGMLIRPVQDCRGGYGSALGLARIMRLDEDGFVQRLETRLAAGADWPGTRLHTYSAAGAFEFIDGSHRARVRLPL
ncbi:glucosamine inositolphosphorylceramide transferase family protein [Methylobacterium aerolatum]|uniref:Glucosamine inositolphosphorylceramide transferase 1 N-terminal domain-containing protein n=1 Tax=Methylobacterium aerolatum TaxID=418708 RepID=A0ABU0HV98_9HYPH|nr:hypothetical protein [Methylobacterium aerolatum]